MPRKDDDSFNEVTGLFQELNNVKKESLRGGRGLQPRGPQKKAFKKPKNKQKKPAGKTTFRQETKYQMIKLIKSGRTLREANALVKALSVGLTPEYLEKEAERNLSTIEYGFSKLTRTRAQQINFLKFKFKPRPSFPIRKEEFLARWLMGQKPRAIDWKRDGNLVRKGKYPTPSRDGSSKGKIGKTRVRGDRKVLRNFKRLIAAIAKLQASGKGSKSALNQALKNAKVASSIKTMG